MACAMNRLSIFLFAGTFFSTVAPALAAQDSASIKLANKVSADQPGRVQSVTCGGGVMALDHGPRATTTPWVLAQRKAACVDALAARSGPAIAG
jgi:hypothetical protein